MLAIDISTASSNVSVSIITPESTLNVSISSPNDALIFILTGSNVVSESSTYDNSNTSIHVNSDQPIAVSAFNWLSETLGEYIVLPCHDYNITKYEYCAVTPSSTGWSSQVLLIGCENDTNIIITLSEAVFLLSDSTNSSNLE